MGEEKGAIRAIVVNAFSGADGWGVGARRLGLSPVGFELDADACATAKAAGHLVVRQDVTTLSLSHLRGKVQGLIGSPPCTDFSKAGRRKGVDGETGRLIFEMPRLWGECRPEWIALEQVPEVLPWWRQFASGLRAGGYSTWCGILDAADYGDPQNRQRAILVASRTREVGPPSPTHTQYPHPALFGEELLPWVSMAVALGWRGTFIAGPTSHATRRRTSLPAPTVLASADNGGWRLDTHRDQRPDGATQTRVLESPAPAVTAKASGQWAFERPATSVQGTDRIAKPGHHDRQWNGAIKVTLEELAALQSFPPGYPFQGNKTSRARQIGNAIPSGLAAAVLSAASGIPLEAAGVATCPTPSSRLCARQRANGGGRLQAAPRLARPRHRHARGLPRRHA